jgi:hypothetical protein
MFGIRGRIFGRKLSILPLENYPEVAEIGTPNLQGRRWSASTFFVVSIISHVVNLIRRLKEYLRRKYINILGKKDCRFADL